MREQGASRGGAWGCALARAPESGVNLGIVGLGGLGHMGLKFASSFGADVVVASVKPDGELKCKMSRGIQVRCVKCI